MAASRSHPMRLASWAIAGALLTTTVWFLTLLSIPRFAQSAPGLWQSLWAGRLQALVLFTPLVIGAVVMVRAEKLFKRAALDEGWTEAELTPVRSMLNSPAWKWLTGGALLLALLSVVLKPHGVGGNYAVIYLLILPLGTVTRMLKSITPPDPTKIGLWDGNICKPMRSEHWGETGERSHNTPLPS